MTGMHETDPYSSIHQAFRWNVPEDFNIAQACCTRWASDPQRIAILDHDAAEGRQSISYADIQKESNRLSNLLQSLELARGSRVAIILPQCPQVVTAHMACHQLGAIAMPMSILFGPEAISYRLQDSEAQLAIIDSSKLAEVGAVRVACPALRHIIVVDSSAALEATEHIDWHLALARMSTEFAPLTTRASDPAILIYTSGTTGSPKGALLSQAALLGNLPGFTCSQNDFPKPDDVFWSPADWAWTGGLMDALLPTLYFGLPIVASRERFSAEHALHLLEKYQVTNSFLFPTALKIMMKAVPESRQHFQLKLRAIMSAGEAVGDTVFHWAQSALGLRINEMFGQTEANYLVGNSSHWPARPGSMGKPYPGHRVTLLDETGNEVPSGEIGEVALHRKDQHGDLDPVIFLGYWNRPVASQEKYRGDWLLTGDLARVDSDGYFWYQGRADDLFKAAGYRIGPSEIENCLLQHPAVLNAAVVPKPDAERGNLVKAFVVLTADTERSSKADADLIATLQQHVRERLAPYEYPREIEFIDSLPMTTTGKVQRRVLRLLEEERAR